MDRRGMVPWRPASSRMQDGPSSKQRREEALLQPFYEEQKRQEEARKSREVLEKEASLRMRNHKIEVLHQNFQDRLREKRLKELLDISVYTSHVTSRYASETEAFSTQVDVSEKITNEVDLEKDADRINFEEELKRFESKGYELGGEPIEEAPINPKDNKGKNKQKEQPKTTKDNNPKATLTKANPSKETPQEGTNYIAEIKERLLKNEQQRFEMEQKLRADELAANQEQEQMEEAQRKKAEEDKALRESEETKLMEEKKRVEEAEEMKTLSHRLEIEQQILEQRSREWEAVLARDHELLQMMRHDRDTELNLEKQLWEEEKQKKAEEKRLKHKQFCEEVILQIASLAENSATYRESTNCALPNTEWWEWRNLFVKGAVQPLVLNKESSSENDAVNAANEVAKEVAVRDYIKEEGEWKSPEVIGTNKELGNLLVSLFQVANSTSPVAPSFLASMQLKLSVIGCPYTGKTFLAKVLEEQFGILWIDVDVIIASAITAADSEKVISKESSKLVKGNIKNKADEPSPENSVFEDKNIPAIVSKESLGNQAKAALSNGLQVPDEVIVQLLILTLDEYASSATSVANKDNKKKDDPPQKNPSSQKKDIKKEQKPISAKDNKMNYLGFILDGFPKSTEQAKLLEKGLKGLELKLDPNEANYVSIIAPPESDMVDLKPEYPLDCLFALDTLGDDDALKQATGKLVDPKTGISYHLEHNPPPANDRTGIAGRLKQVEDTAAAAQRIKDGAVSWGPLFEWISRFSNLFLVHRDDKKKLKTEEILTVIEGFLDAKFKALAARDAANAALEASNAAAQCCSEAEKASVQAKDTAEKLYLAKLAELEAAALLERSSGDVGAKEFLKKKVSESTSRLLQDAAKAVKEAEGLAEAARKAADDAMNAKLLASESAASVGDVTEAKEQALAAAEMAKDCASKAVDASQKAQSAAEAASFTLEEANNTINNVDKNVMKEKLSRLSEQKRAHTTKAQVLEPDSNLSTQSEQKLPQNDGNLDSNMSTSLEQKLPNNTKPQVLESSEAQLDSPVRLCELWKDIEETYLNKLKQCFSDLRDEWRESQKALSEMKEYLVAHLRKQDERQSCVDDFQGKFNRVDPTQRPTPKMKKQLQKNAETLFSKLNSICEAISKEAMLSCKKNLGAWMQRRVEMTSKIFTTFLQVELERYLRTCCWLYEHYLNKDGSVVNEKFTNVINFTSPVSKQAKLVPIPGWLSNISDNIPQLYQTLQQAILASDAIAKAASNENSSPKGSSKNAKAVADANAAKEPQINENLVALGKAIEDEKRLLLFRFQRLASKAHTKACDAEVLVEGSKLQMESWITKSHQVKMEISEEVMDIVREAIEESIPLWYYMCVDGDHFTVDETRLQLDPPEQNGLQPLPDLSSYHYQVLQDLVKAFQTDYPQGYVSIKKATETINSIVESVHTACKNDKVLSMTPRIPRTKRRPGGPFEVWRDYSKEIFKVSNDETYVIDWRCFLVSLLDMQYHNFISVATIDDILQAHLALKEASESKSNTTYSETSVTDPEKPDGNSSVADPGKTDGNSSVTDPGKTDGKRRSETKITAPEVNDVKSSVTNPGKTDGKRRSETKMTAPEVNDVKSSVTDPGKTDGKRRSETKITAPEINDVKSSPETTDVNSNTTSVPEENFMSSNITDIDQFLSIKFWFDSDKEVEVGAGVKRLLFNMFDIQTGLPWRNLLLYLCKDSDIENALRKSYAAMTGTLTESVSLTVQELLQLVYPSGIEGALEQGCKIWTLQDLQNIAEKLESKKQTTQEPEETILAEFNVEASDSDACCTQTTRSFRGSDISQTTSNRAADQSQDANALECDSQFSENAVSTMNEFLSAVDINSSVQTENDQEDPPQPHETEQPAQPSSPSLQEGEAVQTPVEQGTEAEAQEEAPQPQRTITLEDLLASELSSPLMTRFASLLALPVAPVIKNDTE